MNNKEIVAARQVASQNLVNDEAGLLEDNEDLRASALWWKALYEEAQRRYADLENMGTATGGRS
jgi:hypothetical protein